MPTLLLVAAVLLPLPGPELAEMTEARDAYRAEIQREDLTARLPISDATVASYNPTPYSGIVDRSGPPLGAHLSKEEMTRLIAAYFPEQHRVWALRVSRCESNWYTAAKNPRSSAAGLFQFLRSTWDWVAGETGTPSYDQGGVWEVHSQMVNAAWLVDPNNGGRSHWVCK